MFIHGLNGSSAEYQVMIDRLIDDGWPAEYLRAIDFADPQWGCNLDNADAIAAAVSSLIADTGEPRIDIVAHSMGTLSSRYFLKNLGGTELVAHFHGPAAPGQAAAILHNISPSPSPLGSPKNGCVTLSGQEQKDLKKGLLYINIHSSIAPNGEIRGQVLPVKGVRYTKVPPSTSTTTTTTPTTSTTSTTMASPSGAFLDLD